MKISYRILPLAVLVCALLWGSAFPAIKAIYAEWAVLGIEPDMPNRLVLAGVRFMLGGAVLLVLARHPLRELKQTSKWRLLGFACAQTYIQYIMFYTALVVSSAVLGGLLVGSGSIWWLLLAPLLLKSPWPSRWQWGFIGLGVIGVVIAVYRPGAGSGQPVLGAVLFCLCTLSGSLGLIVLQKILKTMGARAATGYGLLLGGVMFMLSGVSAWSDLAVLFSPRVMLITAYLAFVSALGFGLWNHLTSLFPVNLLAGYRFLVPVCAVVESSLLVSGESPGAGIWIGGSLVVAALIGLQRAR
ncbi:MAG: DMT family transporter [Akkermansiaceae bacterium]|nr:DMT family transporter [Akkermansiaceae bacterium]